MCELLNAPHRPRLSTMQLSSQSNTLLFFLPSFLYPGFTSTSVQRVLGHSECLCSKLTGVKQSCGHAVTTLSPTGLQSICLWACSSSSSSRIRCPLDKRALNAGLMQKSAFFFKETVAVKENLTSGLHRHCATHT